MNRITDIIVTIVFLVLGLFTSLIVVVPGFMLAMASDSCGVNNCNVAVIELGMGVAIVGPGSVWLATTVLAVVLLALKRRAWLFALLGWLASGLAFLLGVAIVFVQFG